jgi:hypothetical protein
MAEEDDELLAAETGHDVGGAGDRRRQSAGYADQRLVAALMTVGIVVLFEVIDIAKDRCQRAARPRVLRPHARERGIERAPVGHLRQRIDRRQLLQRRIGSAQADAVERRRHCENGQQRQRAEPPGVVVMRHDAHRQRIARRVPDAIVVRSDHAKAITAGRHVRVIRRATRPCIDPIRIEPFQLVTEAHFLWRDETQRRVMKLETVRFGRQRGQRSRRNGFAIDQKLFDDHRRRQRIARQPFRIDHHQAIHRRKPQPPVVGLPRRRLRAAVALRRGHAVGLVVRLHWD